MTSWRRARDIERVAVQNVVPPRLLEKNGRFAVAVDILSCRRRREDDDCCSSTAAAEDEGSEFILDVIYRSEPHVDEPSPAFAPILSGSLDEIGHGGERSVVLHVLGKPGGDIEGDDEEADGDWQTLFLFLLDVESCAVVPRAEGEDAAQAAGVAVYFRDGTMTMARCRGGEEEEGEREKEEEEESSRALVDNVDRTAEPREKAQPAELERIRLADERLARIAEERRELMKTARGCQQDAAKLARGEMNSSIFARKLTKLRLKLSDLQAKSVLQRSNNDAQVSSLEGRAKTLVKAIKQLKNARRRLDQAAAILSSPASVDNGVEKAVFTHFLRWRLVGEAAHIYPISSVDSNGGEVTNGGKQPELAIRGYRMELGGDGAAVCRATSTALGFAAHLTILTAKALNVPLRYKVKRAGCSRCSIGAKVVENETGRIADVELPLHFEANDVNDKAYIQRVRTGVALLNRNVESILRALHLPAADEASSADARDGTDKDAKEKSGAHQRPTAQLLRNLESIAWVARQGREAEIMFAASKRERTKKS